MAIPRIIHQLWKDEALPPRYQALQDSWRRHNPGFEIRLWTDRDMEALVERRYPHLLSLYQAYEKHVCRTDLARYLILDRFGGVYADLDCECLKPIEPLIANERLVIAPEPDSHSDRKAVEGPGLGRLLCPTFMASEPGHRFWTHLVERIRKVPLGATVMEATGPHVLTAAHETFPESATITLLPAETVYPFDDIASHSGRIYDIEFWERSTRHAYAIHYWDGTWYEHGPRPDGLPTNFSFAILNRGRSAAPPLGQRPPSISCLMAPGADEVRVLQALESMRSQTWPHMQLVVPGEALGAAARRKIAGQADVTIVDRPSSASWIVAGLEQSRGEAIALWDPLELSDPRRLEIQYLAGRHTGSSVCLMRRRLIWQPGARRLGVSGAYPVASSLTGERSLIAAHGSAETADALLAAVMKDVQVTTVDSPRLCVVIADEDDPAFEATWAGASTRFSGDRYDAVLDELSKRLSLAPFRGDRRGRAPSKRVRAEKVLVLTPIRDARRHLPRYLELVGRLDRAGARISLAFLEGDSRDGTAEAIAAALPELKARFERAELHRHDFGFQFDGPRWAPEIQRRRREAIARARNQLLAGALKDEDWVLWLDADLADYPTDLLERLLAADRPIIVPHCVRADGSTFDLNTFRFSTEGGADDPAHLRDGLFQPPRGAGRLYLDAFQDRDLMEVDAVGGTALLVRADLHRDGLNFPPYSYRGYIETEGLAMIAQDMGIRCWALPKLRITHADS